MFYSNTCAVLVHVKTDLNLNVLRAGSTRSTHERSVDAVCCVFLVYEGLHNEGKLCFQDEATLDDFVDDEVDLVHVEHEIELTDVLKAAVERLHDDLDEVEDAQLALGRVDDKDKEECGVVAVDALGVRAPEVPESARRLVHFNKIACCVGTADNKTVNFTDNGLLLLHSKLQIEFTQTGLSLVVKNKDALYHLSHKKDKTKKKVF